MNGITGTTVGYTGGFNQNPSYHSVCRGDGHTESIQVEYDPAKVSYDDLLDSFFAMHFPSPSPTQYKSAVWYHDEEQRAAAEKVKATKGEAGEYVVVQPACDFHKAEEYHQKYYAKANSGSVRSFFSSDSL
mmetsp:Transcript_103329/g.221020  ORF Transcript_103329/g.221020 Transcript_103329/m.221020 type:complete len:131 (-) Transcript_103329:93-485(-)